MSDINRSLNLLYPPFLERVQAGLAQAHLQGLYVYVFEGFRSTSRQSFLYAQGRTTPGSRVTWVRPGFSLHEYGVAVDLVFDGDLLAAGIQWSWEGGYADKHGDKYDKLAVVMKAQGLEWLGDKNVERAHFQLSLGFSSLQMKTIVGAKGLLGLWHEFDAKLKGDNHG